MNIATGAMAVLLFLSASGLQAAEIVASEDIVVHFDAIPSRELTPEAAKRFNITPAPNRAVLTVDALKNGKHVPAQVYAGAINVRNYLINVPIREKNEPSGPRYLGEFQILPEDTLTFIVNVNVLGTPLKAKFTRNFNH